MWDGYQVLQGRKGWTCCLPVCNEGNAGACFLAVLKGSLPPPYRGGWEPDSGTRNVCSPGTDPEPCAHAVLWESCFPAPFPQLTAPCSIPGKPSKGSAVQLPGKVFTHFQDWSTDLYRGDEQQRSLSAYYCHSFFDAIATGGCWSVQPSPKTCTPTPCPSAAAACFCCDKLQRWERWVWLVHSLICAPRAGGITAGRCCHKVEHLEDTAMAWCIGRGENILKLGPRQGLFAAGDQPWKASLERELWSAFTLSRLEWRL